MWRFSGLQRAANGSCSAHLQPQTEEAEFTAASNGENNVLPWLWLSQDEHSKTRDRACVVLAAGSALETENRQQSEDQKLALLLLLSSAYCTTQMEKSTLWVWRGFRGVEKGAQVLRIKAMQDEEAVEIDATLYFEQEAMETPVPRYAAGAGRVSAPRSSQNLEAMASKLIGRPREDFSDGLSVRGSTSKWSAMEKEKPDSEYELSEITMSFVARSACAERRERPRLGSQSPEELEKSIVADRQLKEEMSAALRKFVVSQ
ncbi:hypothetical protein GQ600_23832 [Phytophthora cactorum]|nr:hypothetical protein GQ600_23832 [Phytophthora cactorum]